MTTNRLDQILLDLGYAGEDEVRLALRQQQGLGGRLGSHLIYAGVVTEEQLAHALAVRHGVAPFRPDRDRVAADVLERLPSAAVRRLRFLPLVAEDAAGRLGVVMTDPDDQPALAEIRRLTGAAALGVRVAPEVTFNGLLAAHLPAGAGPGGQRGIALPDLFAADEAAATPAPADAVAPGRRRCVLVGGSAFLRDFLVPVFAREGVELTVAADAAETAAALAEPAETVLVAEAAAADFAAWLRKGEAPRPRSQVAVFRGVAAGLMDNPAPYAVMQQSLLAALELHAQARAGANPLPCAALRRDVARTAAALGLPALLIDCLEAAVLCLAPAGGATPEPSIDWDATLDAVRSLKLPRDAAGALAGMRALLSEHADPRALGADDPETAGAAQVLALVWHLHTRLLPTCAGRPDQAALVRSGLREKSGSLATSAVVEACLEAAASGGDEALTASAYQVLVVGGDRPPLAALHQRLAHLGYRTLVAADADEARRLCGRHDPAAVFCAADDLQGAAAPANERFGASPACGLFAVTGDADASRMLDLLDRGCDDVFCLPRDLELVPARLRRAVRERGDGARGEGLQADFAAIGFTDLLQTLAQGRKSVRVRVQRGDGERAELHLESGRLTHAVCGGLAGPDAVYRVITWEDDGRFAVDPVQEFPAANVALPLEAILMEGCRLLDESHV
jgi:DNA-binding response OmpR family regulator